MGVQPPKPQRRALEQNPAAVRHWLTQDYPAICAQARREGGVVVWLDEMGVRSDAAAGRSWAPVGQTPVSKRTGKRFRVNMVSAISNAGRLRFRLFTGSFTGAVCIDFLGRLLRDCGGRRVHLIVDGHLVHRAKVVSAWVGRHAERIERHFLPGESPELTPVELLNQDVKPTPRDDEVPGRPRSLPSSFGPICVAGSDTRGGGPVLSAPAHLLRRRMNHPICPPP